MDLSRPNSSSSQRVACRSVAGTMSEKPSPRLGPWRHSKQMSRVQTGGVPMTVWECRRETQQRAKRERFGGGVGGGGLYLNPAPPLSPGRELGRQGGSCIRKPPAGRVSVRDCSGGVLSICDNLEDHAFTLNRSLSTIAYPQHTPLFETDAPAPASAPPLQRETRCRSASRPGVIDSATQRATANTTRPRLSTVLIQWPYNG